MLLPRDAINIVRGDRRYAVCAAAVSLAVLAKFLWPLFAFDIPLGYDAGLYRYLFLKHGAALPPFVLGDVEPWARGHPLGLFFFTSLLMKLGVPVDWLVGWIWNVFAAAVLFVLAWVWGARAGKWTGLIVLLMGLLSIPYYDGFSAMYWKNAASLLFMVLAFHLLERRKFSAIVPGLLTLVTHNQTGLLFGLAVGAWWTVFVLRERRNPGAWRAPTFLGFAVVVVALLVYLPIFEESVRTHLDALFAARGSDAPSGAFPDAVFYLRTYAPALLFGIAGFWISLRERRELTLWHWTVLISLAFIVIKLFFYKRFFLHLDFFLLPFMAIGVQTLWTRLKTAPLRVAVVVLLIMQGYFSIQVMQSRRPVISSETMAIVRELPDTIPPDAYVLALENVSPMWIRGYLPDHRVAGPGLLSLPWEVEKWETVLYGEDAARQELLKTLEGPLYFVLTPEFDSYYGEHARPFLQDPCLERIPDAPLIRFVCT